MMNVMIAKYNWSFQKMQYCKRKYISVTQVIEPPCKEESIEFSYKHLRRTNDLEQTLQMMLEECSWSKCNDGRM